MLKLVINGGKLKNYIYNFAFETPNCNSGKTTVQIVTIVKLKNFI